MNEAKKMGRKPRRFLLRLEIRLADEDGGSAQALGFGINMERTARTFEDVLRASVPEWREMAIAVDDEPDATEGS